jgi:PAS domain S-box-containing protein
MEIEKILGERDLIVSSTDKKGIICYVNSTFEKISEYTKEELYGQPHNIIRHPDMPRAVFKYVWNQLTNQKPIVAYVKNYIKGKEKYYWVKAVMYPKIIDNEISTITSYRTRATTFETSQIKEVYKYLTEYEKNHTVEESFKYFLNFLDERCLTYDKMINRLNDEQQILNTTLLNLDIQKFRTDHMIFRSRIESLVEKGYKDIDVLKPACSDFGQRLEKLEGEEFSNDTKFIEIKRLHEKVHSELQLFADSDIESQRKSYMTNIYKEIDTLFVIMEELKNEHKYNIEVI